MKEQKQEAEQHRLNREAYERYKAAHPEPQVVPPIGESAMLQAAGEALIAHDRVWPRKI